MRVGVIAGEMEGRSTGVGRYVSGLLQGLTQWDHGAELVLFFKGKEFEHPFSQKPFFSSVFSNCSGTSIFWEQTVLRKQLKKHQLDVLFCPDASVPFGIQVPTVVTIHDLSFEVLPCEFEWRERWRRRLLARRASRVARRILTDTRHVAEELHLHYGIDPGRIAVIPPGAGAGLPAGTLEQDGAVLERLGVKQPYLLSVGTVLNRRMPRLLFEVFSLLLKKQPDLQLVIAGAQRLRTPNPLHHWISELGIGEQVRILGWVREAHLAPLYRMAQLNYYLSTYEGFGMPPLESLRLRTPVVVGPGLALDELWSDYPFRVPNFTVETVVEMTNRILEHPAETARVMAGAESRLAGCNWRTASEHLVQELAAAAS